MWIGWTNVSREQTQASDGIAVPFKSIFRSEATALILEIAVCHRSRHLFYHLQCRRFIPDIIRMAIVVKPIFEIFKNVIQHLFVFGVDTEAGNWRSARVIESLLFHDEWFGHSCHHSQRSTTFRRWTGYAVAGPKHRWKLQTIVFYVSYHLH